MRKARRRSASHITTRAQNLFVLGVHADLNQRLGHDPLSSRRLTRTSDDDESVGATKWAMSRAASGRDASQEALTEIADAPEDDLDRGFGRLRRRRQLYRSRSSRIRRAASISPEAIDLGEAVALAEQTRLTL